MECKCCNCPFKEGGIEALKEQAKNDFNNMLETFFKEHPYVDNVYISNNSSYFSHSVFIHNDSNKYISINLK